MAFLTASGLLTKGLYMYLEQDSWIAVILACLISLPVVWMYGTLNKWYPSKSLIEINEEVFGRIIGSIISVIYVFYFISISALNTRDLGNFAHIILPNTPVAFLLIVFIFVCTWAVKKGAWNITSYGTLFVVVSLAIIIINSILLIGETRLEYFTPSFTFPVKDYVAGTHLVSMLPLCEIFIFFMFVPYMKKTDELGKVLSKGLVIGTMILLLIVARDITVLGDSVLFLTLPSYSVVRLINVGEILTRLEIVYSIILIMLLFIKVSAIMFATVSASARLMKFTSYSFLVNILGAFTILYAISVFPSESEHVEWTFRAAPMYSTLFLVVLPAVTLITAAIRKAIQKTPLKGTKPT